jgi:SSS family solute:Na+ symporter
MLAASVFIYLFLSLAAGILAGRLVKTESDFVSAGRKLPLIIATATVFATWFGSETVLGASSRFLEEGINGTIEDPFGASLCLLLVGLFFARPLYRMNLLTFGDYYKVTYGAKAEFVAAVFLILSYLGWVAAQLVASGIIIHSVVPWISITQGVLISAFIVIAYTVTGGMWAVSITDFIQTILIIAGLIAAAAILIPECGGISSLIESAPDNFFRVNPERTWQGWLTHVAAWITIGLGSIPQQDVYQRVMASKNEKTAVRSSLLGAGLYLTIALIPLLLTLCAKQLLHEMPADGQLTLPMLILNHTGTFVQILFFGALLSAVMSTASGALLAPAVILAENIVVPRIKDGIEDKVKLRITRICVIAIGFISVGFALWRQDIYELVGEAFIISLVGLFVPLCAGLFFKSRNANAAITSMISGTAVWLLAEFITTTVPPLLFGLAAAILSMVIISVILPSKEQNASLHH